MPERYHIAQVSKQLKARLNGHAFLTMPRMEITNMVREASGEDTTRIKSGIAEALERALLEQGVRCYPSLGGTTTGDTIRLFHAGSVLGGVVDLLIYPSNMGDKDLGVMLTKIKGKWDWSTPTGPAAQTEDTVPIPSSRATDG